MIGFLTFLLFFSAVGVVAFLFFHLEKSQRTTIQVASSFVRESNHKQDLIEFPISHPIHEMYHDKVPLVPHFIASIANIGILTDRCFPITSSGIFLYSYQDKFDFFQKEVHRKCKRFNSHYFSWFKKKEVHFGTTAVLGWIHESNYFHWMTEVISKLAILKESNIPFNKVLISVRKGHVLSSYEKESLKAFGLNIKKDVLLCSRPCRYMFEEALLIPPSQTISGAPSKWYVNQLKEAILDTEVSPKAKRKIYISRNDSTRKIVNEKKLLNKLKRYGFESICLSKLSLKEQATLFSEASLILSSHGAGLTNLMFCSDGAELIEIFPPRDVMMRFAKPDTFKKLASALKIKYSALFAESLDESSIQSDLEIDIPSLMNVIQSKLDVSSPALV